MSARHRAKKKQRENLAKLKKGRHRQQRIHSEVAIWLGTGAVALGVCASLSGGTGIAHAESSTDDASSSTSDSSPGPKTKPTRSSERSTPGSRKPPSDDAPSDETDTTDRATENSDHPDIQDPDNTGSEAAEADRPTGKTRAARVPRADDRTDSPTAGPGTAPPAKDSAHQSDPTPTTADTPPSGAVTIDAPAPDPTSKLKQSRAAPEVVAAANPIDFFLSFPGVALELVAQFQAAVAPVTIFDLPIRVSLEEIIVMWGLTNEYRGRPVIGNGANGTADSPDGKAGGWLYGNGGNGYSPPAGSGQNGGKGGASGFFGNGGNGGNGGSGGAFLGIPAAGGNGGEGGSAFLWGNGGMGGAGGVGGTGTLGTRGDGGNGGEGGNGGLISGSGGNGGAGGIGRGGGKGGNGGQVLGLASGTFLGYFVPPTIKGGDGGAGGQGLSGGGGDGGNGGIAITMQFEQWSIILNAVAWFFGTNGNPIVTQGGHGGAGGKGTSSGGKGGVGGDAYSFLDNYSDHFGAAKGGNGGAGGAASGFLATGGTGGKGGDAYGFDTAYRTRGLGGPGGTPHPLFGNAGADGGVGTPPLVVNLLLEVITLLFAA